MAEKLASATAFLVLSMFALPVGADDHGSHARGTAPAGGQAIAATNGTSRRHPLDVPYNRWVPPRYAFWTLLIDNKPTAFRAREREELLPTFHQLQRKNADIVMKWFARGKLWDTPEAAAAATRAMKAPAEKRAGDWRPGGTHKDPRDRFKKKNRPGHEPRPARDKSTGAPRGDRPWSSKAHGRPASPPTAEQIVARPKPPERG